MLTPPVLPKPSRIQYVVARHFHITVRDLRGPSRRRYLVQPRWIAMSLLRELLHYSLADVGLLTGRRDHSTVHRALEKVAIRRQRDPRFAELYDELRAQALDSGG